MLNNSLRNVFTILNNQKIRYVVIRNYFPPGNLNMEEDIDILVYKKDLKKFRNILLKNGWLKRLIPNKDWCHKEFFKVDDQKEKIYLFDVQKNILFGEKKIKICPENIIFSKRWINKEGFFVPNDVHAFVLLFFHLAIDKDSVSQKKVEQLEDLLRLSHKNKNFFTILEEDFYPEIREFIKNIAKQKNFNYSNINKLVGSLSYKKLWLRRRAVLDLWQKLKIIVANFTIFLKRIKLIAFIGVDGSGKTTLINELRSLSPIFKTQLYLGWNDYYFKFIAHLNKKMKSSLMGRINFFIFHTLLPFDFWFRYLQAKKNSKYGIIIADRYPLPKKNSGIYRKLSLSLTYFLLPQPSAFFILEADRERVWERKKEGNYKKFKTEFERCNNAKDLFNCKTTVINTDYSVGESFNKVFQEIRCLLK